MTSAVELAAAVGRGEASALDAVNQSLQRIDALDNNLQAWAHVDGEAARSAAIAGVSGPLAGVPVGIKDIFDVAGMPTGLGAAFAAFQPQGDAEAVRRLKSAGAIVIGKTHTTQFASLDPAPTVNPWNPGHTPGGSSSGSAAAVAAGMVPIALGSQTVGSVLRPAAYCGVVGLKPTHGRISATGVFPLASSFDHVGIFSRSVTDAALVLNVIAGYDAGDLFSRDVPVENYLAAAHSPKPPVILLPRRFYHTGAEDELIHHIEAVADALVASGARLVEVDIPAEPDDLMNTGRIIQAAEAAAAHAMLFQRMREHYRPNIRQMIDSGLQIPATRYVQAMSQIRYVSRALNGLLTEGDVLLMPSAPTTAPLGLNSTGSAVLCAPGSFAGLPAISLPSGIGIGGLPLAVQLIGKPWQEAALLSHAAWVENELAFDKGPPL